MYIAERTVHIIHSVHIIYVRVYYLHFLSNFIQFEFSYFDFH